MPEKIKQLLHANKYIFNEFHNRRATMAVAHLQLKFSKLMANYFVYIAISYDPY